MAGKWSRCPVAQLTSDPSRKEILFSGFETRDVEAGCYLSITNQELSAPLSSSPAGSSSG